MQPPRVLGQSGRPVRILCALALGVIISACATGPKDHISLIPADQVVEKTSKDGLFTQPLKSERTKPGCKGECPQITVDSLVFPGVPILTELVDHALAVMTGVGDGRPQPYDTVSQYEQYFWKTAAPRDSTVLSARTRYRNKDLTVIELNSWQYFTGAAHGISATQFLNWDNRQQKVLGIDDIVRPDQHSGFVSALEQAHQQWLTRRAQEDAGLDLAEFKRLWPFTPSDNLALTDKGVIVKYDSYQIAPYSMGQPELLIPYQHLSTVLQPQFVPR